MSNILCGLDVLEDSEIISVIAIIEVIDNINKDLGIKKTKKKILEYASYLTSIFRDTDLKSTSDEDTFKSLFNSKIEQLNNLNREELTEKFKHSLRNILSINNNISDDALCIKLINNTCTLFNINLDEMPLYKAKKIFDKYCEFAEKNYSNYIFEIDDLYGKYTTINKKIIDTLNRSFSIQKNLLFTKEYIESNGIETIVSEVLAFITFLLSSFSLDKIYPKLSEFKVTYDEEFENNFNELLIKVKNSHLYIMTNNQKIISLKHDLRGFSLKLNREEKRKNDCIDNLNKLKSSKQNLSAEIDSEEQQLAIKKNKAKMKVEEISDLDEITKMNIDSDIFKLEKHINILKNKLKNINNEGIYGAKSLEHITSELNSTRNKMKDTDNLLKEMELKSKEFEESVKNDKINYEKKSRERLNMIKHRWTETFKEFAIKDEVYNSIKDFNSNELFKVEMAILEISKMEDVSAISVGKIDKFYDYVILNTSKREPIKIFFEISPFGSLVKIEKVQKELLII